MKSEFLSRFEGIPYFTIEGYKQLAGEENNAKVRTTLHRWAIHGHILPLKKGVYMARGFYGQRQKDPDFLAAISAILIPMSYVSLEYVLQKRNILTEVTYPVTCITVKNTRKISNKLGTFWYRHVKPDYYLGFSIQSYHGIQYAIASTAKALFDYLYLRPIADGLRRTPTNLAEELRLNLGEFSAAEKEEFEGYVKTSSNRKMEQIFNNLRKTIWQP